MKIDGFHIDGYGVHHDLGITDLPDGLTIVAGPNEAGKTTLQHFLVGMLFGFTAVNRPDHHAPLNGGTYGGRLFLSDASGRELTVHRGARKSSLRVTDATGPVPDAELHDLLGGASRDLYESIFAVHLDELAELKALTDEQVRDRVFSAGILGAGRTAQRALAQLTDERDELFKPKGRSADKYLIKRLQAELSDARAHLSEVQRASTSLPGLTTRLAALATDRTRLRSERDRLQAERTLLAVVTELWPSWTAAAEARADLDRMGDVETLPSDAGERLARGSERHDDLDAEQARTGRALHVATSRRDSIEPAGPVIEHEATIIDLTGGATAERERQETAADQAARVDQLTDDLRTALAQLGPDCDEAWLNAHPDRAEAGAELQAVASRVVEARQQRDQAIELDRRTAVALDDAEAELSATEAALADGPHHPVDRAQRAVEDATVLVGLVTERDAANRRLAAAQTVPEQPLDAPTLPRFAVPGLVALAIAMGVAGTGAVVLGETVAGIAALVISLIVAVLGLAIRRSTTATKSTTRDLPVDALTAEVAEIDAQLEPVLQSLGLPDRPTLAEATNLQTKATHLATEATHLERQRAETAQQRQALAAKVARHEERSATERAEAESELAAAQAAWRTWLADQALPTTLDPRSAAAVLDALGRAHGLRRELARARADHDRTVAQRATYARQVSNVVAISGLDVAADPATQTLQVVAELGTALAAEQDAAKRRAEADQAVEAARQAHEIASERSTEAATALQDLLRRLGAATVDDANAKIERSRRAEALRATIAQADRDLATAVGSQPDRLDQARTLLAQADPTRWADELRRLDQALRDLDDQADHVAAEAAHLSREADELERSADVPRAELRVADLEAQLVDAVTRWASLTLAHRQVEGTLARYQRERQPDVVKQAATRFEQVTGGRYRRLEVRGQQIVAIDDAGREVEANALSQGATEQLYLCMRFALAESFARTAPMPLLLDDIIVNADGGRMPKLAETIADVATDHQVFVFTCHDATVEMLQAVSPDARLIALEPSSKRHRMGLAAG